MNTLDQDLRWDLRYGVQMFCKHSLWLLKYASLALIGGAIAIVLAFSPCAARRRSRMPVSFSNHSVGRPVRLLKYSLSTTRAGT